MIQLLRNRKGQVAIFIALLFQVLFLFFAMIINVGLLVHHKINLQNSVDLAAYYGASKQAEVLNAIAHVNYQIRQSWKLLTWRQRVLGTAGHDVAGVAPYNKLQSNPNSLADVLAGGPGDGPGAVNTPYRLPRFCITYDPHELQSQAPSNENSCKNMHDATEVKLPNPGLLQIPGFFGFGTIVSTAITGAISQVRNRCTYVGALNFIIGGRFIIAHNNDAEQRAHLINYLSTGLSADTGDFYEIDGGSAKQGIERTLSKNLTDANRATMNFQVLNGLAQSPCGKTSSQTGSEQLKNDAPPWLVPVEVYPVWRYYDCTVDPVSGGGSAVGQTARQLSAGESNRPANLATAPQALRDEYSRMEPYLGPRPVLTGFEKDPWCMAYVGVKATTSPRIPFMPLSNVTLTAEAFSKPFGGRIGPWYTNTWKRDEFGNERINATANNPEVPGKTEKFGGVRVLNVGGIGNIDSPAWAANISRFPGDTFGWASERVLAYFHRIIRNNAPNDDNSAYMKMYTTGSKPPFPMAKDFRPSLRHYDQIGNSTPEVIESRDQLTWDVTGNGAPRLRLAEIAAIAPDLFDLSYYSIDPDFYNNYFEKIERHIASPRSGFNSQNKLLGDLGSRFEIPGFPDAKKFNIFDQLRIQRFAGSPQALNSDLAMPYLAKNPAHLLNSWSSDSIVDFSINTKRFGNCRVPEAGLPDSGSAFETPLIPATPGNCIDGGRVGYSVKLVAKDYLMDPSLELGGQGTTGYIRNQLPADW